MSHVRDPIESALADLDYLRVRLDAIRCLAVSTDRPGIASATSDALRAISKECTLLIQRVNVTRKALDSESIVHTSSILEPRPMKKAKTPSGQKNRKSLRVQVTLDQETRERFDLIQARLPEFKSLSAAIRYASRVAVEHLPKKSS